MTFTQYGLVGFEVQYMSASGWATVPGGVVTGNDKVWRKFAFSPVTTDRIRVLVRGSVDMWSRIAEVEAYEGTSAPATVDVRWLVSDQLGTPRMVLDKTGGLTSPDGLSGMRRHDYLPFGEELSAGTGGRTSTQGYGGADNVRQKFTGKERDNETNLDYFHARYYSNIQGRFTSVDPLLSSGTVTDPQTWNRYGYALNNPLKWTDPDGLFVWSHSLGGQLTDTQLEELSNNENMGVFRQNFRNMLEARRAFRLALADAARARDALPAGAERDLVSSSLASYGTEGQANGVSVGRARLAENVAAEARTAYFPFENGTFRAQVEVVISSRPGGGNAAVAVAHEGRHVADAQEFAGALTADVAANGAESTVAIRGALNRTKYEREVRGYTVSSLVAQGLPLDNLSVGRREIWNNGWSEADRATRRSAAIDNHLRESPTYRLTPQDPGPRFIPR